MTLSSAHILAGLKWKKMRRKKGEIGVKSNPPLWSPSISEVFRPDLLSQFLYFLIQIYIYLSIFYATKALLHERLWSHLASLSLFSSYNDGI